MEYEPTRTPIDVPSRVMSSFGLMAGLGALGLMLWQFPLRESRESLQASFNEQLTAKSQEFREAQDELESSYQAALDRQEARNESWNQQLSSAVSRFESAAAASLDNMSAEFERFEQERSVAFKQSLEQWESRLADATRRNNDAATPALTAPSNTSGPNTAGDGGTDIADTIPEIRSDAELSLAGQSTLRHVPSTLRAGEGTYTPALIENMSDEATTITRVRFRPTSRFRASSASAAAAADVQVLFEASHNKSRTPGFHGTYDLILSKPIPIDARDRRTVQLTIANDQFAGWGFIGKAVLDYGDRQQLTIPAARVIFVPQ